jgi:hypothetical protein
MLSFVKSELPSILTSIIVIWFFATYFLAIDVSAIDSFILNSAIICTTLAVGVGIINLLAYTYREIQARSEWWYLRIWMLVMLVVTAAFGLMGDSYGSHPTYLFIMNSIFVPVDASIFAMVMFDISAGFYRTMRARTWESSILLICAFLLILKNAPVGASIWPGFETIGTWIYDVPSGGSGTAFRLVSAIGIMALAIRVILRHERELIGGRGEI